MIQTGGLESSAARLRIECEVARAVPEGEMPRFSAAKAGRVAGETVLIVEDNAANLELVRDLLEVAGYSVEEATSGEDAISKVNQHQPQLVLMDLRLPGIDGLAVTRKLKGDPATKDVIIVALTAYAMRGDAEKVFEAGCDGYMSKPIDTREFPKLIAQFLSPTDQKD